MLHVLERDSHRQFAELLCGLQSSLSGTGEDSASIEQQIIQLVEEHQNLVPQVSNYLTLGRGGRPTCCFSMVSLTKCSIRLVEAVHLAEPKALGVEYDMLHRFIEGNLSAEVISYVVTHYPQAMVSVNASGDLPVVIALKKGRFELLPILKNESVADQMSYQNLVVQSHRFPSQLYREYKRCLPSRARLQVKTVVRDDHRVDMTSYCFSSQSNPETTIIMIGIIISVDDDRQRQLEMTLADVKTLEPHAVGSNVPEFLQDLLQEPPSSLFELLVFNCTWSSNQDHSSLDHWSPRAMVQLIVKKCPNLEKLTFQKVKSLDFGSLQPLHLSQSLRKLIIGADNEVSNPQALLLLTNGLLELKLLVEDRDFVSTVIDGLRMNRSIRYLTILNQEDSVRRLINVMKQGNETLVGVKLVDTDDDNDEDDIDLDDVDDDDEELEDEEQEKEGGEERRLLKKELLFHTMSNRFGQRRTRNMSRSEHEEMILSIQQVCRENGFGNDDRFVESLLFLLLQDNPAQWAMMEG